VSKRAIKLLCLAVLAMLLPRALAAQTVAPARSAEAVIQPGDSVHIFIWQRPEMSGSFLIAGDGAIQHPIYRELRIGGLTVPAAEQRVGAYLSRFAEAPQFMLVPSFRVVIDGAIARPGLYNFGPEVTVVQAIGAAGGHTPNGRDDRAILVRGGERLIVPLLGEGAAGSSIEIRSGDRIVIERRSALVQDILLPGMRILDSAIAVYSLILLLGR
jgi:polysaccharide export outer membrane protein